VEGKAEPEEVVEEEDKVEDDQRDLDWSTVLKRTFESYVRGERCVIHFV
jgi:WD repeat and SOF domain-containing protein 1